MTELQARLGPKPDEQTGLYPNRSAKWDKNGNQIQRSNFGWAPNSAGSVFSHSQTPRVQKPSLLDRIDVNGSGSAAESDESINGAGISRLSAKALGKQRYVSESSSLSGEDGEVSLEVRNTQDTHEKHVRHRRNSSGVLMSRLGSPFMGSGTIHRSPEQQHMQNGLNASASAADVENFLRGIENDIINNSGSSNDGSSLDGTPIVKGGEERRNNAAIGDIEAGSQSGIIRASESPNRQSKKLTGHSISLTPINKSRNGIIPKRIMSRNNYTDASNSQSEKSNGSTPMSISSSLPPDNSKQISGLVSAPTSFIASELTQTAESGGQSVAQTNQQIKPLNVKLSAARQKLLGVLELNAQRRVMTGESSRQLDKKKIEHVMTDQVYDSLAQKIDKVRSELGAQEVAKQSGLGLQQPVDSTISSKAANPVLNPAPSLPEIRSLLSSLNFQQNAATPPAQLAPPPIANVLLSPFSSQQLQPKPVSSDATTSTRRGDSVGLSEPPRKIRRVEETPSQPKTLANGPSAVPIPIDPEFFSPVKLSSPAKVDEQPRNARPLVKRSPSPRGADVSARPRPREVSPSPRRRASPSPVSPYQNRRRSPSRERPYKPRSPARYQRRSSTPERERYRRNEHPYRGRSRSPKDLSGTYGSARRYSRSRSPGLVARDRGYKRRERTRSPPPSPVDRYWKKPKIMPSAVALAAAARKKNELAVVNGNGRRSRSKERRSRSPGTRRANDGSGSSRGYEPVSRRPNGNERPYRDTNGAHREHSASSSLSSQHRTPPPHRLPDPGRRARLASTFTFKREPETPRLTLSGGREAQVILSTPEGPRSVRTAADSVEEPTRSPRKTRWDAPANAGTENVVVKTEPSVAQTLVFSPPPADERQTEPAHADDDMGEPEVLLAVREDDPAPLTASSSMTVATRESESTLVNDIDELAHKDKTRGNPEKDFDATQEDGLPKVVGWSAEKTTIVIEDETENIADMDIVPQDEDIDMFAANTEAAGLAEKASHNQEIERECSEVNGIVQQDRAMDTSDDVDVPLAESSSARMEKTSVNDAMQEDEQINTAVTLTQTYAEETVTPLGKEISPEKILERGKVRPILRSGASLHTQDDILTYGKQPGLWVVQRGSKTPELLEITIMIEEEATELEMDMLCVPAKDMESIFEREDGNEFNHAHIVREVVELPVRWPKSGQLLVQMENVKGKTTRFPSEIIQGYPLRVSGNLLEGSNTLRFIQLGSAEDMMYVLYAHCKEEECYNRLRFDDILSAFLNS